MKGIRGTLSLARNVIISLWGAEGDAQRESKANTLLIIGRDFRGFTAVYNVDLMF